MSLNGLTNPQFPLTIDGLSTLNVNSLYLNGTAISSDTFVPYVGALHNLDMGSYEVYTTTPPSGLNSLTNKNYVDGKDTILQTQINTLNTTLTYNVSNLQSQINIINVTSAYNVSNLQSQINTLNTTLTYNVSVLNNSISTLNTTLSNYINTKVSKSGDTMTGTLDMGANKITSSYVPIANNDLTNKAYVDGAISTASSALVPYTGATTTVNLGAQKIQSSTAPTLSNDLANKAYVDATAGGGGALLASNNTWTGTNLWKSLSTWQGNSLYNTLGTVLPTQSNASFTVLGFPSILTHPTASEYNLSSNGQTSAQMKSATMVYTNIQTLYQGYFRIYGSTSGIKLYIQQNGQNISLQENGNAYVDIPTSYGDVYFYFRPLYPSATYPVVFNFIQGSTTFSVTWAVFTLIEVGVSSNNLSVNPSSTLISTLNSGATFTGGTSTTVEEYSPGLWRAIGYSNNTLNINTNFSLVAGRTYIPAWYILGGGTITGEVITVSYQCPLGTTLYSTTYTTPVGTQTFTSSIIPSSAGTLWIVCTKPATGTFSMSWANTGFTMYQNVVNNLAYTKVNGLLETTGNANVGGFLGVNNSTPYSSLHVKGTGTNTFVPWSTDSIVMAANPAAYMICNNNSKTVFMGVDGSGYGMLGTFTNDALVFRSNNAERMRITAGGNVGIGTINAVDNLLTIRSGNFIAEEQSRTGAGNNYGVGTVYTLLDSTNAFRGQYARVFAGSNGTIATTAQTQANGYIGLDVATAGVFASDTDWATSTVAISTSGVVVNKTLSTPSRIAITNPDPGDLISKRYGIGDRYGIGQYANGIIRVFTADSFSASGICFSLATDDVTTAAAGFTDLVRINHSGAMSISTTASTPYNYCKLYVNGGTGGGWSGLSYFGGSTSGIVAGQYANSGTAWLGAHNAALTAWADVRLCEGGNLSIGNNIFMLSGPALVNNLSYAPVYQMIARDPNNGQLVCGSMSVASIRNNSVAWSGGYSLYSVFYRSTANSSVVINGHVSCYSSSVQSMAVCVRLNPHGSTAYQYYYTNFFFNQTYTHTNIPINLQLSYLDLGTTTGNWDVYMVSFTGGIITDGNDVVHMTFLTLL